MMRSLALIMLFNLVISPLFAQERIVEKTYKNGKPSLVIVLDKNGMKEKEISYYENGQIEYEGAFKNEREHGKWIYYYKDGQKMYEELYKEGLEEGKHHEWAPDGQLIKTEVYKAGRLIKTIEP